MKRGERVDDGVSALLSVLEGWQAGVWTAMPAIVRRYSPEKLTCEVEVSVQAQVSDLRTGAKQWVPLPLLVDCPVVFPQGGQFLLTFPIAPGDEALVVFASRCIDAWWQSGGVQVQADLRMHDLSDGFVIPGVRSQARLPLGTVSATDVELRNSTGDSVVRIKPSGAMELTSPVSISLTAPDIALNGNVASSGTFRNNGVNISSTHRHTGVDTGTGTSGTPT